MGCGGSWNPAVLFVGHGGVPSSAVGGGSMSLFDFVAIEVAPFEH